MTTMKIFLELGPEETAEWRSIIPDMEMELTIVRSNYLLEGYTPTMLHLYLDKDFITESVKYEEKLEKDLEWRDYRLFEIRGTVLCWILVVKKKAVFCRLRKYYCFLG